jgi:hypothetical protein
VGFPVIPIGARFFPLLTLLGRALAAEDLVNGKICCHVALGSMQEFGGRMRRSRPVAIRGIPAGGHPKMSEEPRWATGHTHPAEKREPLFPRPAELAAAREPSRQAVKWS